MAYKFQIGAARLSGSATYLGKVDSDTGQLSGVQISGSGDQLFVHGTNANIQALDDILMDYGTQLEYKHNGSEQKIIIATAVNKPSMILRQSGSSANNVFKAGIESGVAFAVQIYSGSAAGTNAGWKLNEGVNVGDVSGSGNLTVTTTGHVNGTATIKGSLIVDGDTVALNTTNVTIKDKLIGVDSLAANDAQSRGSGYLFGQDSQNYGGKIVYASSSAENQFIKFTNSNDAGIPLKAEEFIGDGAGVTGDISADHATYNTQNITLSGTPQLASKERTNIIVNKPTNEQEVILPSTASISAGQVVRIKLAADADTTHRVKITGHGNDHPDRVAIDKEPELLLMSPSASLELVYLGIIGGTGSYAIF